MIHELHPVTDTFDLVIRIVIIVAGAILIYFLINKCLAWLIWKIAGKTKNKWENIIYEQRSFSKLAYLVPPIAAYVLLNYVTWEYTYVLRRLIDIWMVVAAMLIFNTLLNTINTRVIP